jgi:hypothetical protein
MKKYLIPAGAVLIAIVVWSIWMWGSVKDTGDESTPAHNPPASSEEVGPAPQNRAVDITPAPSPPPVSESIMVSEELDGAGDSESSDIPMDRTTQAADTDSKEDAEKELEYELTRQFEAEALDFFPLHTVQAHDPYQEPGEFGPAEGEIWVRIKVDHAPEHRDIMAQVADHYKMVTGNENPVTVLLWVGGRPWAKYQYPPPGEE